MERETKQLDLSNGKKAEIKTYLTRSEKNALKKIMLKGIGLEQDVKNPEKMSVSGSIPAENMITAQEELVKIVLVSFDGSADNPYDRLMETEGDEYDEILAEADKIQNGNLARAK